MKWVALRTMVKVKVPNRMRRREPSLGTRDWHYALDHEDAVTRDAVGCGESRDEKDDVSSVNQWRQPAGPKRRRPRAGVAVAPEKRAHPYERIVAELVRKHVAELLRMVESKDCGHDV